MHNEKGVRKTFIMERDYDAQNDSLFLHVTDKYSYRRSLRLEGDIILDFDENNVPVALEILHASKRFNVDKFDLKQPLDIKMYIGIGEETILIKALFRIGHEPSKLKLKAECENSINLPSQETHFSSAVA